MISLTWTDGEVMYDDEYEVSGTVDIAEPGNGWSREFSIYDIAISGPGSRLNDSRAIPEMLPSSWYLEAQDALLDQASDDFYNSGEQYNLPNNRYYGGS